MSWINDNIAELSNLVLFPNRERIFFILNNDLIFIKMLNNWSSKEKTRQRKQNHSWKMGDCGQMVQISIDKIKRFGVQQVTVVNNIVMLFESC